MSALVALLEAIDAAVLVACVASGAALLADRRRP